VSDANRGHGRSPQPTKADPRHARQLAELQSITTERTKLDERERVAIDKARELGLTWAQIATALGMRHRQAAQQLHRRLRNEPQPALKSVFQCSPSGATQPENHAEGPERAAERADSVAEWARSQLLGQDPHTAHAGLLRDLDAAALTLRRCLADLKNRAVIADERNMDNDGEPRPALQKRLPAGWEAEAIDCAGKLRNIADHIGALARTHAQAVADHTAARRHARTAQARHPASPSSANARTDRNRTNDT
jgi:hypothetical protein